MPLRKALAKGLVLDAYAPAAGRLSVVARTGGKAVAKGKARAAGQGTVAVKLRFTKARQAVAQARPQGQARARHHLPPRPGRGGDGARRRNAATMS